MVVLDEEDKRNVLLFSEGYLPQHDVLASKASRMARAWMVRERMSAPLPSADDEMAAWALVAHARLITGYRESKSFPLATAVIGPPKRKNARLAAWFEGIDNPERYRLMVHLRPHIEEGSPFSASRIWTFGYRWLDIKHRSDPRKDLIEHVRPYLRHVLKSYSKGDNALHEYLSESGCHYVYFRNPLCAE
jgi:hypothetical protein